MTPPARPGRFARRSTADEIMDDPTIPAAGLSATLRQLASINTFLGGYPPSVRGVLALLSRPSEDRRVPRPTALTPRPPTPSLGEGEVRASATLLDVGTGAADTPRKLVEASAARGIRLDVTAIDLAAATAEYARAACAGHPSIHVEQGDLFALIPGRHRFDIVHAAMVLHHFPDEEAVRALVWMYALAERGVVINDLHRHPLAYWGIRALTALAWRDPMIRHDAPVSVLRGFRAAELRDLAARAGWPVVQTRLRWWPMFRWQLVADKRIPVPPRARPGRP